MSAFHSESSEVAAATRSGMLHIMLHRGPDSPKPGIGLARLSLLAFRSPLACDAPRLVRLQILFQRLFTRSLTGCCPMHRTFYA
jgi:hypothetical protein